MVSHHQQLGLQVAVLHLIHHADKPLNPGDELLLSQRGDPLRGHAAPPFLKRQ